MAVQLHSLGVLNKYKSREEKSFIVGVFMIDKI